MRRQNTNEPFIVFSEIAELIKSKNITAALEKTCSFMSASPNLFSANAALQYAPFFSQNTLPYGWMSLKEAIAQLTGDSEELLRCYVEFVLMSTNYSETLYLGRLKRVAGKKWPSIATSVVEKYRETMTQQSVKPNPSYEMLVTTEKLSDEALEYFQRFGQQTLPFEEQSVALLRVIAIKHPDEARTIIVDKLPLGTIDEGVPLSAGRSVYRDIAEQLNRLATIGEKNLAHAIASNVISRYPKRPALKEELTSFISESGGPHKA